MAFRDVFCLKGILIESSETNDSIHKNWSCCPQQNLNDVYTGFDGDLAFSFSEMRVEYEE